MIRIRFPGWNTKAAYESWHRACANHPSGAVSGLRYNTTGYWYTIALPTIH